jgi:tetratricopeptide (TPR) repeat protein
MLASRESRWKEAAEAFGAGLALMPDNINARISYARALYLSGERQAARAELEQVLEQAPEHDLARFLIAVLDDAAGESAAALRGYRAVIARAPDHAGANFYLGQAYLRAQDFAPAAQAFTAAIGADAANIPAYLYRDVALEQLPRPDAERARGLEAALKRAPDDALVRYRLARLLALSAEEAVQDPDRALEMSEALAAAQPMPQHVELLALARAANGDWEGAAALLEPLLSLAEFGPPDEAERLSQTLAAYRERILPEGDTDPSSAFLGRPPRLDPTGPIRDYPAPKPF